MVIKTKLIISVEDQKCLLDVKLEMKLMTQEEYDEELPTLKEKSVGCFVG